VPLDFARGPSLGFAQGPRLVSAVEPPLDSARGPPLGFAQGPRLVSAVEPPLDSARAQEAAYNGVASSSLGRRGRAGERSQSGTWLSNIRINTPLNFVNPFLLTLPYEPY
jgi:hypothetical protein